MVSEIEIKSLTLKLKSSNIEANLMALDKVIVLVESHSGDMKKLMPAIISCLKKPDPRVRIKALDVIDAIVKKDINAVRFALPTITKIALESEDEVALKALRILTNIAKSKPEILQRIGAKVILRKGLSPNYVSILKAYLDAVYSNTEFSNAIEPLITILNSVVAGGINITDIESTLKEVVTNLQQGNYPVAIKCIDTISVMGSEASETMPEVMITIEGDTEESPVPKTAEGTASLQDSRILSKELDKTETQSLPEDMTMNMGQKGISDEAFEKMAEMLLQKAREAYERGDYEAVEKYTLKIEELAQKSKVSIYIREVEDIISTAESTIEWAKNIGADVSKAVALLNRAKKAFKEEYYEGAMNLAKQAIDIAETAKNTARRVSPRVEAHVPSHLGLSSSFEATQNLLPEYTFDRFVVGNSNRFAHAAAVAVAEKPGQTYNPLFIYSSVGLGKTHLLQAIGNYIVEKLPHLRVMYVTTEKFIHDLMEALEVGALEVFRKKYREVDILLIDDVHFLSGQEATQEEFYNTFNALYNARKQIVLTSDRPPVEIAKLEKRILTRFEQGLITDIQPPDLEMRMVILRRTADEEGVRVPEDVIAYIAKQIRTNIRTLKGAIKQTVAYSTLTGRDITVDLAKEVLKSMGEEITREPKAPLTRERIARPEVEEEEVVVMQPLELEPGHSYLIEETRPKYVFEVLMDKLKKGYRAMCITRTNPQQLLKKYELQGAKLYWLTDRKVEGTEVIRPSLERMITTLENFMQEKGPGILVLDGVEYLVSLSRFDPVLKFLRELIDVNSLTETIFVVPLNPSAISRQEISMLERELETIKL